MPPIFLLEIQRTVLSILQHPALLPLRGCHPLVRSIPGNFESYYRTKMQSTPHLLHITARIQFALCCFRSLLLTASQLISFPPGTKTFQFPGLLILSDYKVRSHSEILGSKATCASPRLFAACHVLPHLYEPSPPPISVILFCLCMVS